MVVSSCELEELDEPDVCSDDPFGNGVEDGDRVEHEPLEVSHSRGNFVVDTDEEEEEEPLRVMKMPVVVKDTGDPFIEEPEAPGNLDDLDNSVVVAVEGEWEEVPGDEEFSFILRDGLEIDITQDDEYSDLDLDPEPETKRRRIESP